MRTRIALAAAVAATYMIMSFDVLPAGAQSTAAVPHHGPRAGGSTVTDVSDVGGNQSGGLSINRLLWPSVVDTVLPASSSGSQPATSGATGGAPTTTAAATSAPAAATPPAPAPPPPPPPPPTDATSTATADWQCIRIRESGDVYNDPSRPSGAYGILVSTWQSFGYSGWPYQATPSVQDALALRLYNEYGWSPWSSAAACGLG